MHFDVVDRDIFWIAIAASRAGRRILQGILLDCQRHYRCCICLGFGHACKNLHRQQKHQ